VRASPHPTQITRPEPGEIVYAAVGRSSSVLLVDVGSHFQLSTNGLAEARIERAGMLLQGTIAHWLGLLPALLRPEARDLLVIGLGGEMALEPVPSTIESIDVIELEPKVLAANQRVPALRAIDPLADPRARVHLGDARGALRLTQKRYDAIVSQPSHPWTAGASRLYTREFFSLVRSHLSPDGVFVQWIGLRFVDAALLRALVATLVEVFAHVEVYQPRPRGLLFAASDTPLDALAGAKRALRAPAEDDDRIGIHRVEDFAAARALDAVVTRALAAGAALNTDDHNLLASRASRLGEASLDTRSAHALLVDLDPLLAERDGLAATGSGWRFAAAADWEAVAALDAQLASIGPGDALFEEASRLRVSWRLAVGDLEKSAKALAIVEAPLPRQWHPVDALQRARAAIAVGRPPRLGEPYNASPETCRERHSRSSSRRPRSSSRRRCQGSPATTCAGRLARRVNPAQRSP
jgi:spermidine synthase